MIVNKGKQGCQNCVNREYDNSFGLICQHKASIEGIEVMKNFYTANEVSECDYYEYDENLSINRQRRMEMREILFRGKAINRDSGYYRTKYKNGDWVYGLLTQPYNERYDLPAEMTNTSGVSGIEVDCKTIGQFTGLSDKNGVKIFEGDIVKGRVYFIGGYRIRSLQVVYDSTAARFVLKDVHDDFKNIPEVCEVVGNIYDNGYPF